jgi:hypothetical protein
MDFLLRLPHKLILADYRTHPEEYSSRHFPPEDWATPSFIQHPLTQQFGVANVGHVGFYTDKVVYVKKDTFYRCSIGNVWSMRKFTCWIIQSKLLCKCGCGGLCTMNPIMEVFNRSCNALQRKQDDAAPLPLRCIVGQFRGDWPERAALAGLKNHAGNQPCQYCEASKEEWHGRYAEVNFNAFPFPLRTHSSYLEEVRSSIVHILVDTEGLRHTLVGNLRLRLVTPFGRVVKGRSPHMLALGLHAGDKLCPFAGDIRSIHDLDVAPLPLRVVFLKCGPGNMLVGLSILWNIPEVSVGENMFHVYSHVESPIHVLYGGCRCLQFCIYN